MRCGWCDWDAATTQVEVWSGRDRNTVPVCAECNTVLVAAGLTVNPKSSTMGALGASRCCACGEVAEGRPFDGEVEIAHERELVAGVICCECEDSVVHEW